MDCEKHETASSQHQGQFTSDPNQKHVSDEGQEKTNNCCEDETPHSCLFCKIEFNTEQDFSSHLMAFHHMRNEHVLKFSASDHMSTLEDESYMFVIYLDPDKATQGDLDTDVRENCDNNNCNGIKNCQIQDIRISNSDAKNERQNGNCDLMKDDENNDIDARNYGCGAMSYNGHGMLSKTSEKSKCFFCAVDGGPLVLLQHIENFHHVRSIFSCRQCCNFRSKILKDFNSHKCPIKTAERSVAMNNMVLVKCQMEIEDPKLPGSFSKFECNLTFPCDSGSGYADKEMLMGSISLVQLDLVGNKYHLLPATLILDSEKQDVNLSRSVLANDEPKPEIPQPQQLTCQFCKKVFKNKNIYRTHMKIKHSAGGLACQECCKVFIDKYLYRRHLKTSHGHTASAFYDEGKVSCDKCNRIFKNKKTLQQHMKVHQLICNICNKIFHRGINLHEHIKQVHNDTPAPVTCKLCNTVYRNKKCYMAHLASVHCDKPLINCDHCDYITYSEQAMHVHKEIQHEGSTFICDTCGKHLCSKAALQRHKDLHNGNKGIIKRQAAHSDVVPVTCDKCKKVFIDQETLQRHVKVHNLTCEKCNKVFKKRYHLCRHIETMHNETPVHFTCKQCNRVYKNQSSYMAHLATFHSDKPFLKCDHCDYKTHSKQAISVHISLKHKGIKLLCDICGKHLNSVRTLRRHMDRHNGKFPFSCEPCKKNFATKWSLTLHMRSYHTAERPYKCDHCDRTFANPSNARHHSANCLRLQKQQSSKKQ